MLPAVVMVSPYCRSGSSVPGRPRLSLRPALLGLLVAAAAWAFVGVRPAAADNDTPATAAREAEARVRFAEGLKHLDNGVWPAAAEAFARTLQLRASPEVRFNLASALYEMGRLREALAQIDAISSESKLRKPVRQSADLMRQRILPRLGHIAVQAAAEDIASVSVDGVLCEGPIWQLGIPVDPGSHDVEVVRKLALPYRAQVRLQAGETVRLALLPQPPMAAPAPRTGDLSLAATAPQPSPPTARSGGYGWLWWTAGAALASFAVLAAQRSAAEDSFEGNAGHFEIGAR